MVRRRAVALLAAAAAAAGAETSACKRGAPRGITLVTQTSVERLRNLRSICERWTGDISVAVYVEDAVEERRMAPTVDAVTRPVLPVQFACSHVPGLSSRSKVCAPK